jgi:hypothetical protein
MGQYFGSSELSEVGKKRDREVKRWEEKVGMARRLAKRWIMLLEFSQPAQSDGVYSLRVEVCGLRRRKKKRWPLLEPAGVAVCSL